MAKSAMVKIQIKNKTLPKNTDIIVDILCVISF